MPSIQTTTMMKMKQVPFMMINFIDVCTKRMQSFDLFVITTHQSNLESKNATISDGENRDRQNDPAHA